MRQHEEQTDKQEKSFALRLPLALHERLERVARRERRTLHAQSLYAIERWLDEHEQDDDDQQEE